LNGKIGGLSSETVASKLKLQFEEIDRQQNQKRYNCRKSGAVDVRKCSMTLQEQSPFGVGW
jgi:hypothetical protein